MAEAPRRARSRPLARRSAAAPRSGAALLLTVCLLVVLLALAALAIDTGVLLVARTELQRSADAAAMAAAWELMQQQSRPEYSDAEVRRVAAQYAALNLVGREAPALEPNYANRPGGEIVVGHLASLSPRSPALGFPDRSMFNAVEVRVLRTADRNREVSLFFSRVLGRDGGVAEAQAQAAFWMRFRGFRAPPGPGNEPQNLMLLPLSLNIADWLAAAEGHGHDGFAWDHDGRQVHRVGDGLPEIRLFPTGIDASGNFGLVDIGARSSNVPRLRRQILHGISPAELNFHGGALELDSRGELRLSGTTGLKAGIEPELNAIVGQARIVPLHRLASGSGTNAVYTIVGFAGMRIMAVQLQGKEKAVVVQAAPVVTRGGIPAEADATSSFWIYSPVRLVQ